jgi:glycosyltransferase involved in cell wall biosynthesis
MREQGANTGLAGFYFRWISSVCFRKSFAVITDSNTTENEARRRFPASGVKITTVHIGVLLPSAPVLRPEKKLPFTLLCVAKLMPYKGQLQALSAFEMLLQKHPELRGRVRLVFHGFPNDEEYVEKLKTELRREIVSGTVELRAYSADKTLDDIYRDASALLFLSQYEGFGLPVIEAQSRGIPVVCSDLPVLREVGGEGAMYVRRDDALAVALALYNLIQNADVRAQQVRLGLENAKRFDWGKTAQGTLAVYWACAAEQRKISP